MLPEIIHSKMIPHPIAFKIDIILFLHSNTKHLRYSYNRSVWLFINAMLIWCAINI